jgi:hypothetical protein
MGEICRYLKILMEVSFWAVAAYIAYSFAEHLLNNLDITIQQ